MDADALVTRLKRAPLRVSVAHRHQVPVDLRMDWDVHELEIAWHRRGEGVVAFDDGDAIPFAPGMVEVYAPRLAHRQSMRAAGEDWYLRVETIHEFAAIAQTSYALAAPDAPTEADLAALTAPLPGGSRLAAAERDHRATALLLRLLGQAERSHVASHPAPEHRLAREARRLLRDRAATIGRIEEVADALGVSHTHLRHVFRRAYGHSLVRELMEARVALAEERLRATAEPLAAIARACGFADAGYLCRVFRQLRGVPPSALRP